MEQGLKSNCLKVNEGLYSLGHIQHLCGLFTISTASKEYIEGNRECAPEKPLTSGSGHSLVRSKIVVQVSGLNNEEQRPCTQVPHIQKNNADLRIFVILSVSVVLTGNSILELKYLPNKQLVSL